MAAFLFWSGVTAVSAIGVGFCFYLLADMRAK